MPVDTGRTDPPDVSSAKAGQGDVLPGSAGVARGRGHIQSALVAWTVAIGTTASPAFAQTFTGGTTTNGPFSSGSQFFWDSSAFNANAANAASGGIQTFNNDSALNASVASAISGGIQSFSGNSTLNVLADNALTVTTDVRFGSVGDTGGVLRLNGHSTTIGSINSVQAGSGLITNGGATDGVLTVDSSLAGPSTFSGVIQDGGPGRLALTVAAGTLTLTGANSHSGVTTVSAGVLNIQNAAALGTIAGGTVVASGGALELQGGVAVGNEALSLAGSGIANGGALRNVSGINSYAGAITLTAATRINSGAGSLELTGGVSGSGNALTLGGNIYGLVTNVTDVTTLTKDGAGEWWLAGANTYSGTTMINAGALVGFGTNALSAASAHVLAAGARLNLLHYNQEIGSLAGAAGAVVTNGSGIATLTTGRDNSSTLYAGMIQDGLRSLALTKTGAGTLTLTGANSYSGVTMVNQGVLNIRNASALGTIAGGTVVASGAALELQGTFVGGNEALSLAGSGIANSGALRNVSGINTYAGAITLTAATRINSDAGAMELSGGISGSGNALTLGGTGDGVVANVTNVTTLSKDGAGEWWLIGTNTYSGATMIDAGRLIGFGTNALSAASAHVLAAGATLNLYSYNQEIGSLAGAVGAVVTNRSGPATLTTGRDNQSSVYAGMIQNGSGSLALTKTGTGVMELSGASTYTGNTNVNGGELRVTGSLGNTAVAVNAGATLSGSGTIGGAVTVNNGGRLSAGNSPGTLTFTSNLTLNSGSTTVFELNTPGIVGGTGLSTGNDLLKVGGNLNLGGTLEARVSSAGYYRLFDYGTMTAGSTFGAETITSSQAGFTVASHQVQYGIPNQVNLSVLGAGQTMQFWDGTDSVGNGAVDGGSGTWGSAGNWTGRPGQANINGLWSGSVGVFMGAAGTVTVSGTQSFDTLQFSTGGYHLMGGTLAFNPASGSTATILVDNGVGVTIGSVLTDGTGNGLTKTGAGTLTLTGANSHTGTTTISTGVLNIRNGSALGTTAGGTVVQGGAALELQGGIAIANERLSLAGSGINNGGALRNVTGSNSYAGAITLTAAARIDAHGGALQLRGGLSGAHGLTLGGAGFGLVADVTEVTSLTKDGTGAWALGGTNTYTGVTTINAGTLSADNRNAFSAASAHILANGAALHLLGLDQTIGSLTGAVGAVVGNEGGSLAILTTGGDNSSTRYAGIIQDGSSARLGLTKTGTGEMELSGANTYTGATTIDRGLLRVTGSLGHTAVAVNAGGTLSGSGTIGGAVTVGNGGTIAPGNSIGTLRLAGTVTFNAGSTYEVEANAGGESDSIAATGAATINGGTVKVLAGAGSYGPATRYTILTSSGRSGAFTGVTSNLAFLDPSLGYDATSVFLTLTRNNTDFAAVGQTRNQAATGAGAESLGWGHRLYDAVLNLSDI